MVVSVDSGDRSNQKLPSAVTHSGIRPEGPQYLRQCRGPVIEHSRKIAKVVAFRGSDYLGSTAALSQILLCADFVEEVSELAVGVRTGVQRA
jgi:hypothetical protein